MSGCNEDRKRDGLTVPIPCDECGLGPCKRYRPKPVRDRAPLPDKGPWQLVEFKGRVFALSQTSGLYEVTAATLRPVELVPATSPITFSMRTEG